MEVIASALLIEKLALLGLLVVIIIFLMINYSLQGKVEELQELPNHVYKRVGDCIGDYIAQTGLNLRIETMEAEDDYTFVNNNLPVLVLSNRTIHSSSAFSLATSFYLLANIISLKNPFKRNIFWLIDLTIVGCSFASYLFLFSSIGLANRDLFLISLTLFYIALILVIISIVNEFLVTDVATKQMKIIKQYGSEEREHYNSYYNLLSLNKGLLLISAPVQTLRFLNPFSLFDTRTKK